MRDHAWRNRIVGHGTEAPDQLLANPYNWRVHPKQQRRALAAALTEVGWVQSVIVNRRTGHVVDGHLRIALALERGEPEVPVVYVDLSEDEERLVLATLDPIGALALGDGDKLGELLAALQVDQAALMRLLDDLAQGSGPLNALLAGGGETPTLARGSADLPVQRQTGAIVEITCSAEDLERFRPTLEAWSERPGVRIHIGRQTGRRHA
jgi:ParB-like chromosome segregation protein Spo0J